MHFRKGIASKQAHVDVPDGHFEEEHGREGFYGPVSHLYHQNPPTNWSHIEGDCRPYAIDTRNLAYQHDLIKLLYNSDVAIYMQHLTTPHDFFTRNADGDSVYFVHYGSGELESDYGPLNYEKGDYLIIPRGTIFRLVPSSPSRFLMIQSTSVLKQPDRGLLGQHALYDPAIVEAPEPRVYPTEKEEYQVKVKRLDQWTTITYPFHPLDVAGWKGNLFTWKLNIKDFRPVMSHRTHLAPSVHTTLVGDAFVICSFTPRPLEEEAGAQKVPFWHKNIDYDEVLFYHDGDFFSRDGIEAGMITFHPYGIHHGPHPKAFENQNKKSRTDEYAVMVDTRNPLHLTDLAKTVLFEDYWRLWQIK